MKAKTEEARVVAWILWKMPLMVLAGSAAIIILNIMLKLLEVCALPLFIGLVEWLDKM